jgi:hypothetical protein
MKAMIEWMNKPDADDITAMSIKNACRDFHACSNTDIMTSDIDEGASARLAEKDPDEVN